MSLKYLTVCVCLAAMLWASAAQASSVIFQEDFEDGAFDPLMTYSSLRTSPGIKTTTFISGNRAFGFGKSGASANAFQNYITWLTVDFGRPMWIDRIQFKIRESCNWGSSGHIYLDEGKPDRPAEYRLADSYLGRQPSNDWNSDPAPVAKDLPVGQEVTFLHFRVSDITRSSELYIDDIVILGSEPTADAIPEPATMLGGLLAVAGIGRYLRRRR